MLLQTLRSLGCQDTLDRTHVAMTMAVNFLAGSFKNYYVVADFGIEDVPMTM